MVKGSALLWSQPVTVGMDELSAPTLKICQAAGPFTVRLGWEENSLHETGHKLEFKEDTATATWETYGTAPPNGVGIYALNAFFKADGSLSFGLGKSYKFRITALRQPPGSPAPNPVLSPPSNEMTVTFPDMPVPTNFRVVGNTENSVSLGWNDNSLFETGAAIQIRPKRADSQWQVVWRSNFPNATKSGPITGLDRDTTYEARLVQFIDFTGDPNVDPCWDRGQMLPLGLRWNFLQMW